MTSVSCRIWAHERSPQGHYHSCHAESRGLNGDSYDKESIPRILETKLTWDQGGKWEILACEPNHDGAACKECQYLKCKGQSTYLDSSRPEYKEALRKMKEMGADIRQI